MSPAPPVASCPRCGRERTVNHSRDIGLCQDCHDVDARPPKRSRARVAECGTDGGYFRHLRGNKTTPKSPPCDACKKAHAAVERARSERLKASKPAARNVGPKPPTWRDKRPCKTCGTPDTTTGRCRSCANLAVQARRRGGVAGKPKWVKVGLVWKAA